MWQDGGGIYAEVSQIRVHAAVFDANTAIVGEALRTIDTAGRITNNTFRVHHAASANRSTVSYDGLQWVCALGTWMPTSGEAHGNFVGCANNCKTSSTAYRPPRMQLSRGPMLAS